MDLPGLGAGGRVNLNFLVCPYGFFESLIHAKQDQLWILLHKLVVCRGYLILILGSKIHNFWTIFWCCTKISHKIQPEIQNLDLKYFLYKNDKNLRIQYFCRIFWQVTENFNSCTAWMFQIVEVNSNPSPASSVPIFQDQIVPDFKN